MRSQSAQHIDSCVDYLRFGYITILDNHVIWSFSRDDPHLHQTKPIVLLGSITNYQNCIFDFKELGPDLYCKVPPKQTSQSQNTLNWSKKVGGGDFDHLGSYTDRRLEGLTIVLWAVSSSGKACSSLPTRNLSCSLLKTGLV